jgi:copper chaperone CopZ
MEKMVESRISFSVSSLECIACAPVFKRELMKFHGIKKVEPLVMLNIINVEIDPRETTIDEVKQKILEIASKAGFGGRIVFSRV